MSDWPLVSLGAAGVLAVDCEHKTPTDAGTGYPYVAIPQMIEGRLDVSSARRITQSDFLAWTRKARPQPYDVVMSRRCNPGETAYPPKDLDFAVGQNLLLLRSDGERLFPPFLRWIVRGPAWWVQVAKYINVGAVFDSLRLPDIAKFELPLPPLDDQRAIAQVLGMLDYKIEANKRLELLVRSYLDALTVTLTRLPSTPLSALVQSSRELVEPGTVEAPRVEHFSIPAFDMGAMPEFAAPSSIKSGKFAIRGPRVLVSRLNPRRPRVWYAVPSRGIAIGSTEFLVLDSLSPYSLATVWLAVTSDAFTGAMQRRATGTSGSHQRIRPADALSIEVSDTRLADQSVLSEVAALLQRTNQSRVESRTLGALRDALLPELLSGRLRVEQARAQVKARI